MKSDLPPPFKLIKAEVAAIRPFIGNPRAMAMALRDTGLLAGFLAR